MALSAITGSSIRIVNIRGKRSKPGLRAQHCAAINLVASLFLSKDSIVKGVHVQSTEIEIHPSRLLDPQGKQLEARLSTAGSTTLVLQAFLPCVFFLYGGKDNVLDGIPASCSSSRDALCCRVCGGGTDVPMSPPLDYFTHCLIPTLQRINSGNKSFHIDVECAHRGYMPRGGGDVRVNIHSDATRPAPFDFTNQGELTTVDLYAWTTGTTTVLDHIVETAKETLAMNNVPLPLSISANISQESMDTASGITAIAHTSTGCLVGASRTINKDQKKHLSAISRMVEGAISELTTTIQSGACVDKHMADQLIIFMALASGTSRLLTCAPTLHTITAIRIAEMILPGCSFTVSKATTSEELHIISCQPWRCT